MAELTYREAVAEAIAQEMRRDEDGFDAAHLLFCAPSGPTTMVLE